MKDYILILNVDCCSNARKICEELEAACFNSLDALGEILKQKGVNDYRVFSLSNFMDVVNDQDLDDLSDSFISYIRLTDEA